jgi:hypothetical protein
MKEVFRVTKKYWAMEEGFGTSLMFACAVFFFFIGSKIGGILFALVFLFFFKDVLQLRKGRVEIDEKGLCVFQGNESCLVTWKEVALARLEENHAKPRKVLVTAIDNGQQIISFNIEQYDHQRIWELTQRYVSPGALAPDAHQKLDGYEEWSTQQKNHIAQIPLPFEAKDSWFVRCLGWLALCMFGSLAWFFWNDSKTEGRYLGTGIGLFFALLGLYVILTTGKTVFTQARLERHLPLGLFAINWPEIRYIEADVYGSIILCGEDKHLYLNSASFVSSKDRENYGLLLESKIEEYQLQVRLTRKIRRFAKNTRVI